MRSVSARAFAIILPVALLLFGFSTWMAYQSSREREIASSMQLLGQDRALAQQALGLKFSELEVAQKRARDRLLQFRQNGNLPDFDRHFPAKGDGTRRSSQGLWDGTQTSLGPAKGFGAFVSDQQLSQQRQQNLQAAFASLVGLVDGLPENVNNLYFFSPTNDLIMHAPQRTDRLQFYRSEAPPELDFQTEEFSEVVQPRVNPAGEMRCTSLRPILYDGSGQTWTTGCMTPVRDDGRQIGAFGSSILLDEIFDGSEIVAGPGIARIIVTGDGQLVRHPNFTLQSTDKTKQFLDLTETDNPALQELWRVLQEAGDKKFEGYLPDSDLYVSASRLGQPQWFVVSSLPGEDVRDYAFRAARPTLISGLLATAAFALFIVAFIRRQLIVPIEELAQRADNISLGHGTADGGLPANRNELERLGSAFDAMESRVTRERLRLMRSFDLLVDAIEEYGILLLDPSGNVTRANQAAKSTFGWKENDNLSQISATMTTERSQPAQLLQIVRESGKASQTVERQRGNGELFWAFEAIEAIRDTNEGLVGFAYIARDVTTQKDAEEQILAARDSATREAEIRRNLLATMSHEIRTPMTGILGMLEEVRKGNSARARDRALASIESSTEALMRVLDDVLQHARAESDALEVEERAFDSTELIQNSAELFMPLARQKGLSLELRPAAREKLLGDPARIQQILANFLSNAIKFTDAGGLTLSSQIEETDKDRVTLTISVQDTGIGVPQDKLEALFNPYEQADASTQREFGGTGLGLSICRNLAQAMGGDVSATSVEGQGSTFSLTLPLKLQESGEAALPGRGQNALVVSASATTSLNAEVCLEELGFGVQSMDNLSGSITSPEIDIVLFDPETAGRAEIAELLGSVRAFSIGKSRGGDEIDPDLTLPLTVEALSEVLKRASS